MIPLIFNTTIWVYCNIATEYCRKALSLCYFQTLNSKKVWIKNMKSKVYQIFSGFFKFCFQSLTIKRVLFSVKPRKRSKHPNVGTWDEFFEKIRKNQWFERTSEKEKFLLRTAEICNILIFAKPLIYESFLLWAISLTILETRRLLW